MIREYDAVILARRVDSQLAERVAHFLGDHGINILLETRDLASGESSAPQLLQALETTKCVLVIVGKTREESWPWSNFNTVFPETVVIRSHRVIPILEPGANVEQTPAFIRNKVSLTFDEPLPYRLLAAVRSAMADSEHYRDIPVPLGPPPTPVDLRESLPLGPPPRPTELAPSPRPQREPDPNEMPTDLKHHLLELEEWASNNKADATRDTMAFWALKLPAIIASASAGLLAHFNLTTISVLAGALASGCVIVDGIHPRGMLRNTHMRAYHLPIRYRETPKA